MNLEVNLDKQLGSFRLAARFAVEGQRIGLFGPSGSGKSTLISLLAGLAEADDGHIQLNDQRLYDRRRRLSLAANRRRIAVVFQQGHLFPHLRVRANLLYGYRRLTDAQRTLTPDEVIEALELAPLLTQPVCGLSGGERQRLALGRALLASPQLLILDEPLSALDHKRKSQIIPFLRRSLRRFDIPYLYISHSLSEMRLMTDQVLMLNNGSIVQQTTAEQMALARIGGSQRGYINHVELNNPREVGGMLAYRWGESELLLTDHHHGHNGLFELSSKEILLFKKHPGALSARNLFPMTIEELIPQGGSVAVVLGQGTQRLVSQVVREAAVELDLQPGQRVFVGIKASVFRPLA